MTACYGRKKRKCIAVLHKLAHIMYILCITCIYKHKNVVFMPFAVILSTIFGAACVFTLLFWCLGAVSVLRFTAKQRWSLKVVARV